MKRSSTYLGLPLFGVSALVLLPQACSGKKDASNDPPPPVIDSAPVPVPPVATSGEPVSTFLDAGSGTPLEQAQQYEVSGQHWLARLVLEPKAFGADGSKAEVNLLAYICYEQGDDACVDKCAQKLGVKKLKFDGGAPKPPPITVGEHEEPETDAAMARALFLKHKDKDARAILEPKLLDGSASKEEIRLLKAICKDQGDRMCQALCDSKLK